MKPLWDEFAYLIHLVRCAIHNEQPTEIPDGVQIDTVYQYGVFHQIANIAFYSVAKLEKKPDERLYKEWEACCNRAVIREMTQSYARDEIVEEFEQNQIRYLEVQGTLIKKFYPQPEYRTMSDIDFIIDLDHLVQARTLLEGLGYECKDVGGVEVDGFRSPNINVEVHTEYFPAYSDYHTVMRPPFSSVEEMGEYDINEFYIYNMLHIAKHYFYCGCGIRRVLDAYFLNLHYGDRIDREYVRSVFETAKVVDFVAELAELANDWFAHDRGNIKRSEMAYSVLISGLHGTNQNAMRNHVKSEYVEGERFFKVKYFFRRLFANKEIMYTHYPFLKRWKILYPFCWIHRAIRALCPSSKKRISSEIKTVISTDLKH